MHEARRLVLALFVLASAVAPGIAVDDGIALTVDRGINPDQVLLEWSGGSGPYRVFRSETAIAVEATGLLLVETSLTSWIDSPPPGEIFFYRVTSSPTAFRVTDIDLLDPHVVALVGGFLCTDVTNSFFNPQLEDLITSDSEPDGLLDFSTLIVFRPLDQLSPVGIADVGIGDCTAPASTTVCDQNSESPLETESYSNFATGTCLAPYPETTSGYSPPVTSTLAPPTCFVSDYLSLGLSFGGTIVPLEDVQLSANYVGDPADSLVNGLLSGFIRESVADTVLVDTGLIGIVPISSLLPGGTGNCASGDDKDTGLDGLTVGWWVYLEFTASEVPYIGP
jgi:hypothetical protein